MCFHSQYTMALKMSVSMADAHRHYSVLRIWKVDTVIKMLKVVLEGSFNEYCVLCLVWLAGTFT